MAKIPQILTASAKTTTEITAIAVMFLVFQPFFSYLTHSPGMIKYISVVQRSAVALSANKTKQRNKKKKKKKRRGVGEERKTDYRLKGQQ